MKKIISLKRMLFIMASLLFMLLIGCNEQPKQLGQVEQLVDSPKVIEQASVKSIAILPTLYILVDSFKNKITVDSFTEKRLVFRYRIQNSSLTMDGWRFHRKDQEPDVDNTPIMVLAQANPSPVTFELTDGMHLTSLVLYRAELRKVFKAIKRQGYKSIIFTPKPPQHPDDVDGFRWEIGGSLSEGPTFNFNKEEEKAVPITGARFNPSPPKKYSKII